MSSTCLNGIEQGCGSGSVVSYGFEIVWTLKSGTTTRLTIRALINDTKIGQEMHIGSDVTQHIIIID